MADKKTLSDKILKESDLYQPVAEWLTDLGYKVHAEVHGCDVAAQKEDELILVELKLRPNLELIYQAVERQKLTDWVYVAIPLKSGKPYRGWRRFRALLRRLDLGLLVVRRLKSGDRVEVLSHPKIYAPRRLKKKRSLLVSEMEGRTANYNTGGITRTKQMTAYREQVIRIACAMEKRDSITIKELKSLGCSDKTASILQNNHYNWFERVSRGCYRLTPLGQTELDNFGEVASHYRQMEQK